MLCSKKLCMSLKEKDCQFLFGIRHINFVYNLFLNTTIFYCGLKFMLVDGEISSKHSEEINSEHIGINTSCLITPITVYWLLNMRNWKIKCSHYNGKHYESDRSHSGFLRGAPVKYGLNSINENVSINLFVKTLANSLPSVYITATKSIMYNFTHVHNYQKQFEVAIDL